jgi:hypothetical protein
MATSLHPHRRRLPALVLALLALLVLCGTTGVAALPKLPGSKLVQRITGKGQADPRDETQHLAASEVRVCASRGVLSVMSTGRSELIGALTNDR